MQLSLRAEESTYTRISGETRYIENVNLAEYNDAPSMPKHQCVTTNVAKVVLEMQTLQRSNKRDHGASEKGII